MVNTAFKFATAVFLLTLFFASIHAQSVTGKSTYRSVIVTTEPVASIWLDGVLMGISDETGKLTIKSTSLTHTLRIRAFGFKEVSMPLTAANFKIDAKLTKTTDRAEIAFQTAEKLMSEDKLKAIGSYEEAIRLKPRYAEALLGLARANADTGDYEGAHAAIKKARLARPVYPEASAVEGRIFRSEDDIDKAIESFERAIREGKGFQPEAQTGLALIFKDEAEAASARGDFEEEKLYREESAQYFEKAIDQLFATEAVVYLLLGQMYEDGGEKKKAILVYERFLRDMPNHEERTAVESFIVQLKKNP